MKHIKCQVAIIGAGPAGVAAALSARKHGATKVILLERNPWVGGILPQCIHDGFGLIRFGEQLTGPEYAGRDLDLLKTTDINVMCNTMVMSLSADKLLSCVSPNGVYEIEADAVVIATGCRERTRGQITIPGDRPTGIYTAGTAQYMCNIQNIRVGDKVIILGSGDIGMIMARRLVLEGIEVCCVLEKLPYCSGLPRNKRQCLDDYDIPLYLSRTVVEVLGTGRLQKVIHAQIDKNGKEITMSREEMECDTLILSVGLIPENELGIDCGIEINKTTGGCLVDSTLQTSVEGIFCCGNSLHVHDLVDYVSEEASQAGKNAAEYAVGIWSNNSIIPVKYGETIRYVLPGMLSPGKTHTLSLRSSIPLTSVNLEAWSDKSLIYKKHIKKCIPAEMLRLKLPVLDENVKEVVLKLG